ncbi:MAG: hypothetical protein NTX79_04465 [Candidatus Micrarchaeota archaeon]|nr:hypothetical protein [Candidatus Micrarchaeota archaeon]
MNNMYHNTKGGKLLEWTPRLERLGIIVPPTKIAGSPFDIPMAQAHLNAFGRIARGQGPYLPYAMLRDNGEPEGTGSGRSVPTHLDLQGDELQDALAMIAQSNPKANGVILQPFVGQPLFKDEFYGMCYGPIISGVAYTQEATERKNAFVRLVYGHPSKAVEGEGVYVAFNQSNYKGEASKDYYPIFESDPISVLVDKPYWCETRNARIELVQKSNRDNQLFGGYHHPKDEFFEEIFRNVIALGQYGPLYIEFALTCVNEKMSFMCLQICEFRDKLAGLPTEIQHSLEHFGKTKGKASVGGADEELLKELYNGAVHDKNVIAAGFDVAGKGNREFAEIIWRPRNEYYKDMAFEKPPLVVYDTDDFGTRGAAGFENGGLVEWIRARGMHTFDVHRGGYCRVRNIIGMGSVERMPYKLQEISKLRVDAAKVSLLIKGKAALEVDASIPFGTLRIERIDSVEPLGGEDCF